MIQPDTDRPRSGFVWRQVWVAIIVGLVVGLLVVAGIRFYFHLREGMPSVEQLENFEPQLSTKLLDRNGVPIKEIYTQRRSYIPLSQTPPCVTQAFLAIEDHKFYEHWGIRPVALAGAFVQSLTRFSLRPRGASTITQQLTRNLYYTSKRSVKRKLREALTAIEIERYYSKDEILEMYLTQTYFGGGAHGIAAAASTYFSKSVPELTTTEAALLAGIPKSPTRYNPFNYPENARTRRNTVLWRMWKVGYLTKAAYDSLAATDLNLRPASLNGEIGIAPYFTEMVRQQLNVIGREHGFDPYRDGVTVLTTLDSRLQACAEAAVRVTLPEIQEKVNAIFRATELARVLDKAYPDSSVRARRRMASERALVDSLGTVYMPAQVALVALDPYTGHILAMIGGRDFDETKFNRAVQAVRQPGSCFKPFVYAAVFDSGVPITTHVSNDSLAIEQFDGTIWSPPNYDKEYGGEVDLREGLFRSLNVVAIRLIRERTTPRTVADLAHRMGITTQLDPYDALALGSSGVIPLDLTAAYQAFLTGGIWSKPMAIVEVTDAYGHTICEYRPVRRAVLSEETAFLVQSLMRSVVDRGTGAGLRSVHGFYSPAAGKTGTTNDFADAWFVGFTPHLIAGVWVGFDDYSRQLGHGMGGAVAALPFWARFMKSAYDTLKYAEDGFEIPRGIVTAQICEETGGLATPFCPLTRTEYFNRSFPLPEPCPEHGGIQNMRRPRPSLF
ncbi:PBP1A family penicillin-binding protein [bacterium]|nr:PBP1A family penicillin-binding protein [bacterium]MBU1984606.1 PBP1A family penicillin-binding protein [bacterium]